MSHHYPPEPGAVRSILAPHMGVLGTERDMLSADLQLAGRLRLAAENDAEDALTDWMHATGPARVNRRREARFAIQRLRRCRQEARDALRRLAAHCTPTANREAA